MDRRRGEEGGREGVGGKEERRGRRERGRRKKGRRERGRKEEGRE